MTLINTADKIYVGSSLASKVYSGTNLVWPSVTYDAATTAWAAAVVTAGGTVSAPRKTLVDNLIVGLKADGVWTKLDRLYLLAAENTQSALIDLVALSQGTAISAPTFTVDQGYTVDAVGGAGLGVNYNPTTDAVHLSQDNCHLGAWNLFNGTNVRQLISDVPGSQFTLYPKFTDNNTYTRVNDGSGGVAIGDPRGLIVGDRNNNANRDTYFNGALLGNVAASSVVLHNSATILFDGGPCSAVSFGGSLTSTNHTAFYNRLRTYMTGVGIP